MNKGTPLALGMRHVTAANYMEAIGLLVAHKAGVLPAAMTSSISGIPPLDPMYSDTEDGGIANSGRSLHE